MQKNIKMNPQVDLYLEDGCGRCKFYATPQCKVNSWRPELIALRTLVLETGLEEEIKWSFPTYTLNGKNIIMVSAFKDYACISFFKGALMQDSENIFDKHGESSQAVRIIKFVKVKDITEVKTTLINYIYEAIEVEKAGIKIEFKKNLEPIPEEFQKALDANPALSKAFFALTPGKQRGYIIHFSGAKQAKTREDRISKCSDKIMRGEAFF